MSVCFVCAFECALCGAWIEFPYSPHPCSVDLPITEIINEIGIVEVSPTGITEAEASLACEETFLSTEG